MKAETLLTQLRERPEEERLAFAGAAAVAVGVVLFLLWGLTFFVKGSSNDIDVETKNQQATVTEGFESLRDEVRTSGAKFETQYEQLRRALEAEGLVPKASPEAVPVVELSVNEDGEVLVEEVLLESELLND